LVNAGVRDGTIDRLERQFPGRSHFPSLSGATDWLNSPPLDPEGLRGMVVVDFCTYTCITQ